MKWTSKDQNSDGKNIGDKKSTGRKIEVVATKFTSLDPGKLSKRLTREEGGGSVDQPRCEAAGQVNSV